ncbi:MAG: mechanosensitive ion channel family protein [Gemmatimonadaceae bacterium]|nr:mechanosensitive ion channel family protein [Geodermatophilaceae bacterium]MBA3671224.1 mechanosensitive ion channel family protein [Gemmatimonadaceae bacterium]
MRAAPAQPATAITVESSRRPRSVAEWRAHGVDYALDKGIDVGGVLIAILAASLLLRFVARRVETYGDDGLEHLHSAGEQRARTAAKLIRNLGRAILIVVGTLMVLNQLDVNISPLLASAGVVGLAVSFGSQSLVRDFVTGFFLQLEHQFALGDVIRIGGVEGTVENITLRLVYLRDATGALHIIPNGQIAQVTNMTRAWGRIVVDVEVSWRDADGATEAVRSATDALGADPAWVDALLDPPRVMGIEKLGGGTVTVRAVARVDPYRRDDVARDLRQRVKAALDRAGIVSAAPAAISAPIA